MADEILPDEELNDEFTESLSSSNEDYQRNLLNIALYGAGTAVALGTARKGLQFGFVKGIDTLGQGNIGIESKYADSPKRIQFWNNYLNVLKKGETPITGAYRVAKELIQGEDLEIMSAEKSIKDLENKLKSGNLNPQERASLKTTIKGRKRNLENRKVAVANKYKAFGFNPPKYEMEYAKHTMTKVTPLMAKVEQGLAPYLGQDVIATEMSDKKMADFKSYATRDRRVQYIESLLKQGDYKKAQHAAKGGFYIHKNELVKPPKSIDGVPLNPKGGTLGGMKLKKLPKAEWLVKNGKIVPTYGLGFVPTTRFLDKKMDYIAGRHYLQLKFIPHKGGYVKAGLDLIDSSDYNWGKGTQLVEKHILGAKPVVNIGKATFNLPRKVKVESIRSYKSRKGIFPAYYKEEQDYSKTKSPTKKIKPSISKTIAKKALQIASRGRIKF